MLHLGIEHFNLVNRLTCNTHVKKWQKKPDKFKQSLSPEMVIILFNCEGWGPTKIAYIKRKVYLLEMRKSS